MRIGNRIAPPHFLAFLVVLFVALPLSVRAIHDWTLAIMTAFDAAALVFLLSSAPLLGTREAKVIERHAQANDANRTMLLAITALVMAVLLISIAAETVGHRPQPFTKAVIIATLVIAWLFSNSIYALHYAHLAYRKGPARGCAGVEFPGTDVPVYWDFVYFAFTLGMTFQTSDVTISDRNIRRVVTMHCLAAFLFNIGVLAFTINVLGSS
ncbi:MAG TPA: DUF1345 domain-containing protein [Sphingomicrobium sp.]